MGSILAQRTASDRLHQTTYSGVSCRNIKLTFVWAKCLDVNRAVLLSSTSTDVMCEINILIRIAQNDFVVL